MFTENNRSYNRTLSYYHKISAKTLVSFVVFACFANKVFVLLQFRTVMLCSHNRTLSYYHKFLSKILSPQFVSLNSVQCFVDHYFVFLFFIFCPWYYLYHFGILKKKILLALNNILASPLILSQYFLCTRSTISFYSNRLALKLTLNLIDI